MYVLALLLLSAIWLESHGFDLAKNLRYFETIHKDEISHNIVKRGINPSQHKFNQIKEIDFKALGKNFRLILSPTKGLLSPNFKAVEIDG